MDLKKLANDAKTRVGSDSTPSEALAFVVKGKGLGTEKISRACTMLNIALLEDDKKQSYSKHSGRIWSHRWPTAKPDEVMDLIGHTTPTTPDRQKCSHVRLETQLESLIHVPAHLQVKVSAPSKPPHVQAQEVCAQDVHDVQELQEWVEAANIAWKMSQTKLSHAKMKYEGVKGYAFASIEQALEQELTPGEILLMLKESCADEDTLVELADHLMDQSQIDTEAYLGNVVTAEGSLDTRRIKRSRASLSADTDKYKDNLTGKIIINPEYPLVKASRALCAAREEVLVQEQAEEYLKDQCERWTQSAHHALFTPVSEL